MAETYKKLVQELVDNSNDTLLTVAANTTVIIRSMRAVNTTGTAATLKLFHDGTAAVNLILPFVTIAANGWAEFDGTITDVKVNNGDPVEYNQTLFTINPK